MNTKLARIGKQLDKKKRNSKEEKHHANQVFGSWLVWLACSRFIKLKIFQFNKNISKEEKFGRRSCDYHEKKIHTKTRRQEKKMFWTKPTKCFILVYLENGLRKQITNCVCDSNDIKIKTTYTPCNICWFPKWEVASKVRTLVRLLPPTKRKSNKVKLTRRESKIRKKKRIHTLTHPKWNSKPNEIVPNVKHIPKERTEGRNGE